MAAEPTEESLPRSPVRGLSVAPAPQWFDKHGFDKHGLDKQGPTVPPTHFTRSEIAAAAEAALSRPVPDSFVKHLAEATCGVPWLVELALSALEDEGEIDLATTAIAPGAVDKLGYELDTTHAELRELLLVLAVGFDLSGKLPASLDSLGAEIDGLMSQARAAGLVLPQGKLVPVVQQTLLETTPAYRLRVLQRMLVDSTLAEGRTLDDVAEGLSRAGLRDGRVASNLERAGDSVLETRPGAAATLYEEARAAGADELSTAARRAQAASAVGDLDTATRILDDLLSRPDAPDRDRAINVAAAIWAQRGMLQRSADVYRSLGPVQTRTAAALATVCLVGIGDLNTAEELLKSATATGSPTLLSVAFSLMGEGVRDSVNGPVSAALPALIRASDMMTAAGAIVSVPESPSVLAALVALHSGELAVAGSVLDRAIAGNQGGPTAMPRPRLFRAWVAMQEDHPDRARAAIQEATDARGLAPRDELLRCALQVGLARRADDAPALVRAWQQARESILHVPIDLYSLLPLGELVVAATRLRDSAWLDAPLADAWALLAALGEPVLWSAPLHWSAAQAAILADRPAELAPHASALVRASADSRLASVLAAAGRAWLAVRAGKLEVAVVEDAARGLASMGLAWDGARLAGHAAARTAERRDMARLLACARSLRPGAAEARATPGAPHSAEPSARAGAGVQRDDSGLSAREREVAGLVLEGNTYEEIGEALFISPRTVEHHVARIRRQLGVSTRSEMLAELRFLLTNDSAI